MILVQLSVVRAHVLFTLFVYVWVYWCPKHIVLCFCFVFLRLVCHIFPLSLNCPFLIARSVFSNVYLVICKRALYFSDLLSINVVIWRLEGKSCHYQLGFNINFIDFHLICMFTSLHWKSWLRKNGYHKRSQAQHIFPRSSSLFHV